MALSILKQKINKREYKTFAEFVRDCALVSLISAPIVLDIASFGAKEPTNVLT
jgi:hypothetical protein